MCRPTTYEVCGKTTWKGCGKHINSVKEKIPVDQWYDKDHPDEEYTTVEEKRGFFGSFCKWTSPLWQHHARHDAH